jgi:hypothetical protein
MRHGDVAIVGRVFAEQYIQTDMGNGTVPATDAANIYNIGSFTMPFAGRATVSFWVRFEWWNSNSYFEISMASQSTPAPSDTVNNAWMDGHEGTTYGSKADIPSYATWNGLTSGQVVNMRARVYIGGFFPQIEWALALVRMYRY